MIQRILIPLDGSPVAEDAIPYAQALLPKGGEAALLRVVPEIDPLLTELLGTLAAAPGGGNDPELDAARAGLDDVPTRFHEPNLHWTTGAARGDPAATIARYAETIGADLIAMTTHGRGALGRTIFGSVADRVARATSTPLLLARPRDSGTPSTTRPIIRRLVVPLDGSELAEAALPIATDIARSLGIPIRLTRVIDTAMTVAQLSGIGFPGTPISAELCQQTLEDVRADARQSLAAAATRLTEAGVRASWSVVDGSPYFAIADATEPGDLLVLTSHGRSGLRRWLLGSVAEKLVREAPVPVVLVPSTGRGSVAG